MVVATKPTAEIAERLLAAYRREQEHWGPREMLQDFFASSPNMLAGTVATCASKLLRPRCSRTAVMKMAESTLREMVVCGHARDVVTFLDSQANRRSGLVSSKILGRLRAGLDRLAHLPERDALLALETVELFIDGIESARGAA